MGQSNRCVDGRGTRWDNGERERVHGQMEDQLMAREFPIVPFQRAS
jgi:hypothetical protein